MPAPLNLEGQRFGKLVVIERAGKVKFGHMVAAWKCRCDCGRYEIVPQPRLPTRQSIPKSHRVTACEVCRRPACVVCGKPVPMNRPRSITCSDACQQTHQRANQLAHYHKRTEQDPGYSMRQYRRTRERMKHDPEYAAQIRERWKEAHRRNRANKTPEEVERDREYQRQWYADNRDYILEQRRQRLAAMSPEERATHDEHMRKLGREWRRRWRVWLDQHPDEKAHYRERYREWVRERELNELMQSLSQLDDEKGNDNE